MENILAQVFYVLPNFFSSLGNTLPPGSVKLISIFGGIFLFLLLMGWARHHQLLWTFKGAHFGVIIGIVLTLVVEALIIIGGKTTFAEIIKNDKIPPAVLEAISKNLEDLNFNLTSEPKALGAASKTSAVDVVGDFHELSEQEQSRVEDLICNPKK